MQIRKPRLSEVESSRKSLETNIKLGKSFDRNKTLLNCFQRFFNTEKLNLIKFSPNFFLFVRVKFFYVKIFIAIKNGTKNSKIV